MGHREVGGAGQQDGMVGVAGREAGGSLSGVVAKDRMETEGLGRQDCIWGETVWGSERVLALKVSTPDRGGPEDVQLSQRLKEGNHHHHHHHHHHPF